MTFCARDRLFVADTRFYIQGSPGNYGFRVDLKWLCYDKFVAI